MITFKEMLGRSVISDVPIAHQHNIEELLKRMNVVRQKYGKPMILTSGYRTLQDHLEIYSRINAKRKNQDKEPLKVPMSSMHLIGCAVDISDPDGSLFLWVKENIELLETVGLWIEEQDDEKRVHFQSKPPKSGNRFFKP